jgi:hypothetical protein
MGLWGIGYGVMRYWVWGHEVLGMGLWGIGYGVMSYWVWGHEVLGMRSWGIGYGAMRYWVWGNEVLGMGSWDTGYRVIRYGYGHSPIPHTKLFGINQQIAKLANIILIVEKILPEHILLIYDLATFLAGLASKGFLKKDPTVWLDGAKPANTCITPSFLGNVPAQLCSVPTPKNTFASIKN